MPLPRDGVIPAALTPFRPDLTIDVEQHARHIAALAAVDGVTAILVNGAAGQDARLDREERRRLVANAVNAAGGKPIIAALREQGPMDLATLARDARDGGARAALLMPPPDAADLPWERALARLSRVVDAVDLPVAVYQTAYATETLARLALVPAVFAVKEGSGDPSVFERNLRALRALGRATAVWSTNSRWLLADLAMGADGILSGMGSVAAGLHVELADAVRRSDLAAARRVNDRLYPLACVFYAPGYDPHTRMKRALVRLGRWTCDAVRPPLAPLDAAEVALVDRALAESGLA